MTINYSYSGTLSRYAQEVAEDIINEVETASEAQRLFDKKCKGDTGADTVVFYEEK